jgi:tetratricopeptide (TPR) repeat protein
MNDYRGCSVIILGVSVALVQMQAVQAISKTEISKTAQSITVLIQNAENPRQSGSGVIIKKEGQEYTVLTAQHVVQPSQNFKIITPTGKEYKEYLVTSGSIKVLPNVDLAILQFTSPESYSVAKMGNSDQSQLGTASFVAGFPGTTAVRSEPTFYFTSGEIAANANRPLRDGYAIAYNNPTLPGMSGGPVLNEQGELIGIHGRAENAAVPQNTQLREDIYVLKTEFNYAVPISTFLRMVPSANSDVASQPASAPTPLAPKADDFFLQADVKLSLGDAQGALAGFDQVLRLNPRYESAYTGRGVARGNLGDYKGAIEDLSQAIRFNPRDVRAYAVRGSYKAETGDIQGAVADLTQSMTIGIAPEDYRAYRNRGMLRDKLKDSQGALKDYAQSIQINPNDAVAYSNRGFTHSKLENRQEALADYNQAIQLNPSLAVAYRNRGEMYRKLGDNRNALADYDQVIRIDPNDGKTYVNRGSVRYALGDKRGALADYDKALQLNPEDALAYNNRGIIRLELGDKQGAIADFKKAVPLLKAQGYQDFYERVVGELRKLGAD